MRSDPRRLDGNGRNPGHLCGRSHEAKRNVRWLTKAEEGRTKCQGAENGISTYVSMSTGPAAAHITRSKAAQPSDVSQSSIHRKCTYSLCGSIDVGCAIEVLRMRDQYCILTPLTPLAAHIAIWASTPGAAPSWSVHRSQERAQRCCGAR